MIGAPFISSLKTHVAIGPVIAEATVGAIQMRGLRTMFGICSIDVPRPWLTRPPQRFSLKLITAKPTICAQQPATAAPPARPVRPSTEQMAADEIGSVSATPTSTETAMPIQNGCNFVAWSMTMPKAEAAVPMGGAIHFASATPIRIVTAGVTRMSIFVSLLTALPALGGDNGDDQDCQRPPAPPSAFAAQPTAASENSTMGGDCKA